MFPNPWYSAAFYSSTYWPRPGIKIRDAMLQRFLTVDATDQSVALTAAPMLVVSARSSAATIGGGVFLTVDRRADFVLVDR